MDSQEDGDKKFTKKPFDKKQYRFKKYSNKFKGKQNFIITFTICKQFT